jgi:hypothetical protein
MYNKYISTSTWTARKLHRPFVGRSHEQRSVRIRYAVTHMRVPDIGYVACTHPRPAVSHQDLQHHINGRRPRFRMGCLGSER